MWASSPDELMRIDKDFNFSETKQIIAKLAKLLIGLVVY